MSSIRNISVIQRKECFVAPELQRNRKQVFDTLVLRSLIFSWGLSTKHFNLHTMGEYMTFPPEVAGTPLFQSALIQDYSGY